MSPALSAVMERAKQNPNARFNSLAHLLDEQALRRAFGRINKDAAAGIDGIDKETYGRNLEGNLQALHQRLRAGSYRHQPILRVHLPKEPGKTRPIGISTIEDKIVQSALTEVLSTIYEQDFVPHSFGYRPGRNAHEAVRAVDRMLYKERVEWIVEADLQAYFDSLDRKKLMQMLRERVADGPLLRLVGKCLNAGVLDGQEYSEPGLGTAQGSVISPLLGNVYLHYALDIWFERWVRPRLRGHARLIRYADDFVIGCTRRADADNILKWLGARMAEFGLTLHPDKTRLVPFVRPSTRGTSTRAHRPGTFDFVGFTFFWRKTRKGASVPGIKTRKARYHRAIVALNDLCRRQRHRPLRDQYATLMRRLRGHLQYFAINYNHQYVSRLMHQVRRIWHKWLNRRSQRKRMSWERFNQYLEHFPLPSARVYVQIWGSTPAP